MEERPRRVVGLRMGLRGDPLTLGQIGDLMGLTRERVRQLEGQGLRGLETEAPWFLELEDDLFRLLAERARALSLLGAEELEVRLQGAGRRPGLLAYFLQKLGPKRLHLVLVSNASYLLDLPQTQWEQWLSKSRKMLRSVAWAGWSEDHCHEEVMALKPEVLVGTSDLLWQVLRESYVFGGKSAASSLVPTTVEQAVRQILVEAPEPFHYTEYCKQVKKLLGREFSDKSIQNSVARAGLLLGRGVYGLPKHIKINEDFRERVVKAAEARISSQSPDRQWHARELLIWLRLDLGNIPDLDQFVLDYLLKESSSLQSLGRLVWQFKNADDTKLERINIQEAVVDILKERERPMTTEAIQDKLVQKRGLGRHFQVHPSGSIKHLGPNLWGLHEWQEEATLFELDAPGEP